MDDLEWCGSKIGQHCYSTRVKVNEANPDLCFAFILAGKRGSVRGTREAGLLVSFLRVPEYQWHNGALHSEERRSWEEKRRPMEFHADNRLLVCQRIFPLYHFHAINKYILFCIPISRTHNGCSIRSDWIFLRIVAPFFRSFEIKKFWNIDRYVVCRINLKLRW